MQMWSVKEYSTHKFISVKGGVQGEHYQTRKNLHL